MLTIFSTPKPFVGHIGVIQLNAIRSWTLLHRDVEVILFGDDEGAGAAARDLNIRHEAEIRKAEQGTKYIDYLFDRAQRIARHNVLCYVNCDIILTGGFLRSVEQVAALGLPFLMVGQRWDTDITSPWDFTQQGWEDRLMATVSAHGKPRPPWFIDYFVFSLGLYRDLPPLVIGRVGWDNWLIWKARAMGAAVVDVSQVFKAVHQNHDYSYHPNGVEGVWNDELANRNRELAGGESHLLTIEDATHEITASGLVKKNLFRRRVKNIVFNLFVHKTLPLRKRLGLQRSGWLGGRLRPPNSSAGA